MQPNTYLIQSKCPPSIGGPCPYSRSRRVIDSVEGYKVHRQVIYRSGITVTAANNITEQNKIPTVIAIICGDYNLQGTRTLGMQGFTNVSFGSKHLLRNWVGPFVNRELLKKGQAGTSSHLQCLAVIILENLWSQNTSLLFSKGCIYLASIQKSKCIVQFLDLSKNTLMLKFSFHFEANLFSWVELFGEIEVVCVCTDSEML